jgi:hypothetical protein
MTLLKKESYRKIIVELKRQGKLEEAIASTVLQLGQTQILAGTTMVSENAWHFWENLMRRS